MTLTSKAAKGVTRAASRIIIDLPNTKPLLEKQVIAMCLGRAHGINVAGKGSPASLVPGKYSDDDNLQFREYLFSEDVIDRICVLFDAAGIVYVRYITDNDYNEPGLTKRQSMINAADATIRGMGMTMISHEHHVNAAGMGDTWMNATGVAVYTAKGQQKKSDAIATDWWKYMKAAFPELSFRSDYSDGDPDYEANFYNLVTNPPAILTEWLFQDNRKDVAWLLDESNRQKYAQTYFDWFVSLNNKFVTGKI